MKPITLSRDYVLTLHSLVVRACDTLGREATGYDDREWQNLKEAIIKAASDLGIEEHEL